MAVLIKGQSIKCTKKSRDHYLRGEDNERVTVREVSGFATKNADEALQMIKLSAKGTRCQKPLYSVKINPETDRLWTKKEVLRAVEMLEKNLGLTGHARVIIEHQKHGRIHYHVLWDRRPPDGGPARNMGNDYAIHRKTQREIEKEFKLRPMMARGRDFRLWEVEYAARYGFDIFKLRDQITADFNNVKSGQEFKAKLEAKGIVLCRGDKSQFVLVLPWGQHKALSSMIYGRPTKAVLRRALADIDITKLPTVAEGKRQVQARLPKAITKKEQARGKAQRRAIRGKIRHASQNSNGQSQKLPQPAISRLVETAKRTPATSLSPQNRTTATYKALAPLLIKPTSVVVRGATLRAAKTEIFMRQEMPHRPASRGGLSGQQLSDFIAACEGRITWKQYFQKWGGGLSL